MSSILISEFITSQALETLRSKHAVVYEPELYKDRPALIAALQKIDALIVRNLTQVNEEILLGAPNLRVVGRLGVGLENIELPACAKRNIKVIPATGANAESVAEYVVGAAVALTRGFIPATISTLKGEWPRPRFSSYHEFLGKSLGIVGFGSIGRVVAKKGNAFGLQCIAYDPMLSGGSVELDGFSVPLLPLNELLAQSDAVTLHLPFLPETKNLFNASTLDQMKHGACLVNTARGGIVDERALAERLRSGRLGGAAMDVFESEPAKDLSHFVGIENLILTPHVAGVTHESNERVSQMIADEVNLFLGV
ncbi:3-phosphoglycerate dehydrogenase [Polynucleobacter wuianus]|uniref:3-phosphoglycerate dehydrogenase n=1 Tax=Polynucleobacter wuianus TaxID=1743168 RepID=A0A191UDT2_9BURK|nr:MULTISPECIES: hydroxyacid dehydrogenase [Polynucleobacter]ANI99050.1 3-phosphoglycerate dehydrogenase [Polynucleobacter wuianus]AWW45849.1 3-phosphoglycerate dehydrogenase [Polynucleobacter paneuropaeus]MBT8543512.1 hydroxyacid dehydrogenase [Polynucleobacter paneuropaeus]MBU3552384.1 hydroxyacid dehydrogenase [Polynucleobacter sp. MWH-Post4-6-1]